VKFRPSFPVRGVNAVNDQAVIVRCELERIVEALHERHGAALRRFQSQQLFRSTAEFAKNRAHKGVQNFAHEPRVVGQAVAQSKRNRQHPLAGGNFGEDVIDKVSSGLGHPPSSTTGAPAAATAGKRNEAVVAA